MYSKQTKIINATGLHARPASEFVAEAKKFASKITIKNLGKADAAPANAKSMIRLLAEGLAKDTEVEIAAEGADEVQAVDALVALIEAGFGE